MIAIVWIVLLLSLITIGIIKLSFSQRQAFESRKTEIENQLMAESALDVFMHRYFFDTTRQIFEGGSFALAGERIDVIVENENTKINVNRASIDLLSATFAAENIPPERATILAAQIVDWRDENDVPENGGAEINDYIAASKEVLPRNGPFETVGEVSNILDMQVSEFRCLRPILTVYSLRNDVDISTSPARIRNILSWAYENNWGETSWLDPALFPTYKRGLGSGDSLLGRSMRIIISLPNRRNNPEFEIYLRFKSSADATYAPLTGLRRIYPPSQECS